VRGYFCTHFGLVRHSSQGEEFCKTLVSSILLHAGRLLCVRGGGLDGLFSKGTGYDATLWQALLVCEAYIGLYLLAPLINAFLATSTRRQIETFLLTYFTFQFFYGWVAPEAANFAEGYSTMSFIFLYVLARYVCTYHLALVQRPPRSAYLIIFAVIATLQAATFFAATWIGIKGAWRLYCYTSPTVILMALSLLLYFSRLSFRSKVVNWFAASSFSVFLLHAAPNSMEKFFKAAVHYLFDNTTGLACVGSIALFVPTVYVAITLIDQLRTVCWEWTWKGVERNKK